MNKILTFLSYFFFTYSAWAQVSLDYYLPKSQNYNANIPTPKQFLGYEVGEYHASPYEVNAYFKELAQRSPRFKIETYGRTYENKELILATVTSQENHSNLDKIKSEHLKLTKPETSKNVN